MEVSIADPLESDDDFETDEQKCADGTAVCSMTVTLQGKYDDPVGINKAEFKCCPMPETTERQGKMSTCVRGTLGI